jgi:hypothetical protein
MRLQTPPQLPSPRPNDKFSGDLVSAVKTIFGNIIGQVNNLTEGSVSAVQNAQSAIPTTGTYQQGDSILNSTPSVLGSPGSQYVVMRFLCVAGGTPGAWVECRALTGT